MKSFFTLGYLFVLAINIISGAFVALGLPLTDKLGSVILFSISYICFERISKMVGVYK